MGDWHTPCTELTPGQAEPPGSQPQPQPYLLHAVLLCQSHAAGTPYVRLLQDACPLAQHCSCRVMDVLENAFHLSLSLGRQELYRRHLWSYAARGCWSSTQSHVEKGLFGIWHCKQMYWWGCGLPCTRGCRGKKKQRAKICSTQVKNTFCFFTWFKHQGLVSLADSTDPHLRCWLLKTCRFLLAFLSEASFTDRYTGGFLFIWNVFPFLYLQLFHGFLETYWWKASQHQQWKLPRRLHLLPQRLSAQHRWGALSHCHALRCALSQRTALECRLEIK